MAYLLCDSGNGYPLLLIFNLTPLCFRQESMTLSRNKLLPCKYNQGVKA